MPGRKTREKVFPTPVKEMASLEAWQELGVKTARGDTLEAENL